jgi:hypothetical protein
LAISKIKNHCESEALIKKAQGKLFDAKKRSKISCQGPFNSFLRRSVSYYQSCEIPCKAKFRGFTQNSAALRDTEFRIIPRNFRQFRMAYGIYGSNKNVRNSVLTEFRGHPSGKIAHPRLAHQRRKLRNPYL